MRMARCSEHQAVAASHFRRETPCEESFSHARSGYQRIAIANGSTGSGAPNSNQGDLPFTWPDPQPTSTTRILTDSPAAWLWFTDGYLCGYESGLRHAAAEMIADLKEAGSQLQAGAGPPFDEIARRRRTFALAARTAEQINAQASESWGIGAEQARRTA